MNRPSNQKTEPGLVDFDNDGPVVDAKLIGDLLNIREDQVSSQIQKGNVTTLCEKGIGEHEGGFRLSFFHHNRRAQIEVDSEGHVSKRTVIDFGDRPLPASLRGPEPTSALQTKASR